jgi:ATP citrate (pro-S)-lyase
MTKEAHPDGKILIVGGGIANFTNVASTFKGIIRALGDFAQLIKVLERRAP